MALVWTQALSVGNDEIDNQHKEFFNRVNKLIDAMSERKGKEEVKSTIQFLETYVIEHFGAEEKLMARVNYPDTSSHKAEHEDFKAKFAEIKKQYDEKGADSVMVIRINSQLGIWLLRHIPTVDRKLAQYASKH